MNADQELQAIKDRNARVDMDKAWEKSGTRLFSIAIVTYVVAGVTLTLIHASRPWLTALVPTLGWILSTLTLTPLKSWWLKKR